MSGNHNLPQNEEMGNQERTIERGSMNASQRQLQRSISTGDAGSDGSESEEDDVPHHYHQVGESLSLPDPSQYHNHQQQNQDQNLRQHHMIHISPPVTNVHPQPQWRFNNMPSAAGNSYAGNARIGLPYSQSPLGYGYQPVFGREPETFRLPLFYSSSPFYLVHDAQFPIRNVQSQPSHPVYHQLPSSSAAAAIGIPTAEYGDSNYTESEDLLCLQVTENGFDPNNLRAFRRLSSIPNADGEVIDTSWSDVRIKEEPLEELAGPDYENETIQNFRFCMMCLQRKPAVEKLFELDQVANDHDYANARYVQVEDLLPEMKKFSCVIKRMEELITIGRSVRFVKSCGICTHCLGNVKKIHTYQETCKQRLEAFRQQGGSGTFLDYIAPIGFIEGAQQNPKGVEVLKKVYQRNNGNNHLARRHLTDGDWDYIYGKLFGAQGGHEGPSMVEEAETFKELEEFVNSTQNLSAYHCSSCNKAVRNGGIKKHFETVHSSLRLNSKKCSVHCDICAKCFSPLVLFKHWISHFFVKCRECGRRFPSKAERFKHHRAYPDHAGSFQCSNKCGRKSVTKSGIKKHEHVCKQRFTPHPSSLTDPIRPEEYTPSLSLVRHD